MQFEPGNVIDSKFIVEKELGGGANGTVFLCMDQILGRKVALKVLKFESLQGNALARFEREARSLNQLLHPNIIRVYKFGILSDKSPYLLMEYAEGETLRQVLEREIQLNCAEAVEIALQLAAALEYAHGAKIIHRDLKPENLLISREDERYRARLLDFGLCKQEDENPQKKSLTLTGSIMGTALYMSPEQCMGKGVDERSDIYSFGCIFYEMLTGEPPFLGSSQGEVLLKHLSEQMPRILERSPSSKLPEIVQEILLKCCQKDKAARYQNFTEVLRDLASLEKLNCKAFFDRNAAEKQKRADKQLRLTLLLVGIFAVSALAAAAYFLLANPAGHQFLGKNLQSHLSPDNSIKGLLTLCRQLLQDRKVKEAGDLMKTSINSSEFMSWSIIDRMTLLNGYISLCDKNKMTTECLKLKLKLLGELMDSIQPKLNKMLKEGKTNEFASVEFLRNVNQICKGIYLTEHSNQEWSLISSIIESKWTLDSTVMSAPLEYLFALRCKSKSRRVPVQAEEYGDICKYYEFATATALSTGNMQLAEELLHEGLRLSKKYGCYNRAVCLHSRWGLYLLDHGKDLDLAKTHLKQSREIAKVSDLSIGEKEQLEILELRCNGQRTEQRKDRQKENETKLPELYEVMLDAKR